MAKSSGLILLDCSTNEAQRIEDVNFYFGQMFKIVRCSTYKATIMPTESFGNNFFKKLQ